MQASTIPAASRRRGVLGWFAGGRAPTPLAAPASTDPAVGNARAAVQQRLYGEIGELIFANALTPSPRTYTVVHSYLSGEDVTTSAAVAEHLRGGARLTEAAVLRIASGHATNELRPETLSRMAGTLEARIADCLSLVNQSCSSAETFGSALDQEAANLRSDPHATLQRIVALTRDAVAATRMVEAQLKRTREEADSLRQDLHRARRAAERDHLTALPNRRCFEQRLHALGGAEDGVEAVVALCDIDDFKQINDRFGHPAGDRVLKFVATFLRGHLGRKVTVARYGGEEFACLFERTPLKEAEAALDAARERMAQRSLIHQDSGETIGHVTFSAGIAPTDGDPFAALHRADTALYAAKHAGKNRVMRAEG